MSKRVVVRVYAVGQGKKWEGDYVFPANAISLQEFFDELEEEEERVCWDYGFEVELYNPPLDSTVDDFEISATKDAEHNAQSGYPDSSGYENRYFREKWIEDNIKYRIVDLQTFMKSL